MHCGKVLAVLAFIAVAGVCNAAGGLKIFNPLREVDPPNKYPWAGWILIGIKRVKCGAVLIHPQAAITAASCLENEIVSVTFGDHNRDVEEGTEQVLTVNSTVYHPNWDAATKAYDVAIITFTAPATINSVVAIIPLLEVDSLSVRVLQKHMRVVGWGYETAGSSDLVRDQSSVLNEITVDLVGTCTNVTAPATAICYLPFRDQTAVSCEGDVGGPLHVKKKGVWTLAGVMSDWNVGNGCLAGERAVTTTSSFYVWADVVIGTL